MVHPIPQERGLAITSLLLNDASYSEIMSRLPSWTTPWKTSIEGPPGVRRYLKSIGVKMTLHGIRKMLKRMGFKAKRKVNTNFVSHTNRGIRLAWARRHQHLAVEQWKSWIFSDETRVNMWGSDGNSYFWTDGGGDILLPH
ncbi:hypothetical protein G6F42_022458 [Rhizopus arrhizus]|nr:hypothetical protein G6F42_022458 [Rhizopus arrhizus]